MLRLTDNAHTDEKPLPFKRPYTHCIDFLLRTHCDGVALVTLRLLRVTLSDLIELDRYDETLIYTI